MDRPPGPVLVVVVLMGLVTLALLAGTVLLVIASPPWGLFLVIAPLLTGFAAYGLWRGKRGSWVVTIALGLLAIPVGLNGQNTGATEVVLPAAGLLVAILLLAPSSSRQWFTRSRSVAE